MTAEHCWLQLEPRALCQKMGSLCTQCTQKNFLAGGKNILCLYVLEVDV